MAHKSGTLLTDVTDFPADAAAQLAALWMTTAEEFASAAYQPGGRSLLAAYLSLASAQVDALIRSVETVLPDGVAFDEEDIPVVLGALPVADVASAADEPLAFAELPTEVDLHAKLPAVRHQGNRGTCVAHATAAVREFLLGEASTSSDLSEQFIYWACKARDGYAGAGTWIKTAMGVLQELGVCPEPIWPYNADGIANNEGQGPPPAEASAAASPNRIVSFTQLNATWVDSLRTALAAGAPVAFSVHVFASCQRPHTYRGGDLRLPLPNEPSLGGHAMCMVGYVDDPSVPGGGYFIVRNSWGEAFGYDGEVAGGYCRLPYEYLRQYGIEAYTAEMV